MQQLPVDKQIMILADDASRKMEKAGRIIFREGGAKQAS
jgi:hypothetical protein